jgi:prevent-host-death family protein
MEVNIHHAKTNLSKLIAAVESGEEVIIARNGKPAVKLVVVPPPIRKSRKYLRGSGIGKLWIAEDAFSPGTDLEIQKLFEADDPKFDNLGSPKVRTTARKKRTK